MPKLKPGTIIPTPEEDAAILAGIAADPEARELDAAIFSQAEPASTALPRVLFLSSNQSLIPPGRFSG